MPQGKGYGSVNGTGFMDKKSPKKPKGQSGLGAKQKESGNLPVGFKNDPMHKKPRRIK